MQKRLRRLGFRRARAEENRDESHPFVTARQVPNSLPCYHGSYSRSPDKGSVSPDSKSLRRTKRARDLISPPRSQSDQRSPSGENPGATQRGLVDWPGFYGELS